MISWRVPALLVGLGVPTLTVCYVLGYAPWLPLGAVAGLVLLLTLFDWVVAAPPGEVTLRRDGPNQVRLGEEATVSLAVTNNAVRVMRAVVRDAWVPSAGAAEPYAHVLDLDPGSTGTIDTVLTPTRRGDRPAVRVTIRSYGL